MRNSNYLFYFLRYINPIWYFNLESPIPYWINYKSLTEDEKRLIDYDNLYSNESTSLLDAAYQIWQKGIIKMDHESFLYPNEINSNRLCTKDQYRFIKKYYSPVWSLVILCIRLLSFKNPFKEISGFFCSIRTKRINVYEKVKDWKAVGDFESELVKSKPLVSIIIPTLNRYEYLDDVIKDLEKQDYKNFEVIVCDQSNPIDEEFYTRRSIDIRLLKQEEKELWRARNWCIRESKGSYLLLFDDDSRVESNWISSHLKCIDFFNVDISSGVSLSKVGDRIPKNYSFYRWGDQLDTGNVLIKKSVFEKTGLFDRQFERQRMGDGEYGLRCYLQGFKNISNPDAKRIHLKVSSGGLREMGSWDAFRSLKLFSPRPIPSVLYLSRKYFGTANSVIYLLLNVPPSVVPYKYKGSKLFSLIGVMLFIVLLPFVAIQVGKAWVRSGKMLKKGGIIDEL